MATKKDPLADEFLPKGYKLPDSNSFMKFVAGNNKFRILSSLVEGYEYWKPGEDGKDVPVRSREFPTDTSDGRVSQKSGKVEVNHFWLIAVWNYASESIQELTITQKSIKSYILERINDPAWGNPRGYDIVVTKKGEGLTTKYTTAANPHSEVAPEILEAYEKANINLEAVFED